MAKKEEREIICPLCLLIRSFSAKEKQYQHFFEHLNKARLEILEAIKALIDERMSELQRKKGKKKVEKIDVES
jgi:hypothetical protein